MSSQCYTAGRIEDAVRYSEAAQQVAGTGGDEVPFGRAAWAAGGCLASGQPQRWAALCRNELASDRGTPFFTRACLAVALTLAGSPVEAAAAADGLIEEAEATRNPYELSFTLFAVGMAFRDTDPIRALDALRRSLVIAQDSGNRYQESNLAATLCFLEARHGDPLAALDYFTLAIRTYHDSGNATMFRIPLTVLAAFLDRFGYYE